MGWLQDQVYSIREAATINMKRLAEEFGSDWAQTQLVPHILGMAKNGNYLYRMTVLAALAELAPFVSQDVCINSVLTVVLSAAKDRVPNIKFNVAQLTQKFVPLVGTSVVESTIRPCLLELNSDADTDVRFFAGQALAVCDACRG
jgi:serine/threonine-protein phosphatase 2A regulatory subunit A